MAEPDQHSPVLPEGIARGGVRDDERSLAPDLARGLMILLIALSNTVFHLWAAPHGPSGWHPSDGSVADQAVQFLMIVGLDLRVYPLFAFLFGYGMAMLYDRQLDAGTPPRAARRLLARRSLLLVAFGFVHALLLMAGDILGAWGLLSLVLGWVLLPRGTRALRVVTGIGLLLVVLPLVAVALAPAPPPAGPPTVEVYASGEPDPLVAAGVRVTTWLFVTLSVPFAGAAVTAMALGVWAARRRVLEEPAAHRRLLVTTAAVGLPVAWLGALPSALLHVGLLDVDPNLAAEAGLLTMLQMATGLAGGLGYAAMVALVAGALTARARASTPVVAVAAVGKRSLSAYLTHSLLFAPVLAAWGLGLGAHLTSATMALFAVGVWLVTVVGALLLERPPGRQAGRHGLRGPAEALLRRLLYRGRAGVSAAPRGPGSPAAPGCPDRAS